MMKQARELGIKAVFAFGDGACTAEMSKLAGPASEGMICSQAGIPTQMASKAFQDAFKAKYGEVKQYAPFFYDATNLLIAAMQKADSTDPAKYLPELQKISYDGATGHIEFDEKGDRKDAEMTIFQMKDGKVEPVAIIKAGKTTKIGAEPAAAAPAAAARRRQWPRRSRRRPVDAPTAPSRAPFFLRGSGRSGTLSAARDCRHAPRLAQSGRCASVGTADSRTGWTSSCSSSSTA